MKKPASPPVSAHTGDGPHNGWLHGFAHPFTLLAWRKHLPLSISALLIRLFALSHGYAHGSGMPPSTALPSYAAGFMLATMLLHLCGIGLAQLYKKFAGIRWIRFSGIIIAGYGVFLLIP